MGLIPTRRNQRVGLDVKCEHVLLLWLQADMPAIPIQYTLIMTSGLSARVTTQIARACSHVRKSKAVFLGMSLLDAGSCSIDTTQCVLSSNNERCFNHATVVFQYASMLVGAFAALPKPFFRVAKNR